METSLIYNLTLQSIEAPKLKAHYERIEKLGGELDFLTYLSKVKTQQENQPSASKWEPALSTFPHVPSAQDRINVLNSNFRFVGIKKAAEKSYYEFVDTFNQSEEFYTNYQFLYFEVNSANESYLISKLPYSYRWNADLHEINKEIPKKIYLIERSADTFNAYYDYLIPDSTHPFLPFFYFTGRAVVLNNGMPLYEYFDDAGLWGIKDALYMSPLRPNVDFHLGQPSLRTLEKLDCWLDSVGYFPSSGTLNNLGRFTGYSTTDLYSSKQTFYLYERRDGSVFLSMSKPHSEAEALAEQTLLVESKEPTLQISSESSSSFLGLQTSSQEILTFISVEA